MRKGNDHTRKTKNGRNEKVDSPMAASAYGSPVAAAMLANVSGRLVPRATKVMAVTESSNPTEQPKRDARSPMTAVVRPTYASDQKKHK